MSLQKSSKTAVQTCMGITEKDSVTILSDVKSEKIGHALEKAAYKITDDIHFFNLDNYGKRPLNNLPEMIKKSAEDSTATFWTARSVRGELHSVRMPFFRSAILGGRHAHMVGITESVFEKGLSGDYTKIAEFTKKIKKLVESVDKIRIRTDRGTDLDITVGRYKWIASTGIVDTIGTWHNLPDGEVFTTPYKMEGTAMIDGTLGDYFDTIYDPAHTDKYPLKLEIENKDRPTLTNIECDDKELRDEFSRYVDQNKNSRIVGELGIGTNLFVDRLMGNMLIDEKYPGIHIAFGDPNGDMTGADWQCPTHIDVVIKGCDIWAGELKIMEKGKYLIDELIES